MKECLAKAEEALRAAEVCFDAGLYDSCASRCYYAMFWAGIGCLEKIGYPPQKWSHTGLASVVGRELAKKRQLFPSALASRLGDGYDLRRQADYERRGVGKKRVERALNWARRFMARAREVMGK